MAKDNKTIGKFRLKGIKRAMAGVPKIEVTFDIDANGILTVSARDQDTGKEQSITITDDGRMSDAEIEAAIRDAEMYASEDQARRDKMESISNAQRVAGEVNALYGKVQKQLGKDEKKQIKSDLALVTKIAGKKMEKLGDADFAELSSASVRLEEAAGRLRSMEG